jgi:hypothetical protein
VKTADALELSEGNVKVRLLRARLQLREDLTRMVGDSSRPDFSRAGDRAHGGQLGFHVHRAGAGAAAVFHGEQWKRAGGSSFVSRIAAHKAGACQGKSIRLQSGRDGYDGYFGFCAALLVPCCVQIIGVARSQMERAVHIACSIPVVAVGLNRNMV